MQQQKVTAWNVTVIDCKIAYSCPKFTSPGQKKGLDRYNGMPTNMTNRFAMPTNMTTGFPKKKRMLHYIHIFHNISWIMSQLSYTSFKECIP